MSDIFNLADTWNAIGTTFNSIRMNVSDGAGGAPIGATASRVLNLLKDDVSTFATDVNGCLYQAQPIAAITELWNVATFDAEIPFMANVKSYLWPGDARYNQVFKFGWNYSDENRTSGEVSVGIAFESQRLPVWSHPPDLPPAYSTPD